MSIGAGKKSKRKQIDTTETRQEDGRGRRGFNKPGTCGTLFNYSHGFVV